MSSRLTPISKNGSVERWQALPREHRLTILGSTALLLLGLLSSLTFAGASSSSTTSVSFVVTGSGGFLVNLIAIPEKRIPTTGNNGTLLTVEVRTPGSTTPLFSQTVLTSSGGTYSSLGIAVDPGTYDITAKGYSHLRTKKSSHYITARSTIDFTAAGLSPLLSGDVNLSDGDNKVNGFDLTLLMTGLAVFDVRYDLNRDTRVNGIDLTNAVSNLNVTGAS